MDEDFRKEPKTRIFDDGSDAIAPPVMPKPPEPKYEVVPHPKASSPSVTESPDPVVVKERRQLKLPSRKAISIVFALILILGLCGGGYVYLTDKKKEKAAQTTSKSTGTTIKLYNPANLPAGYTYNNDAKTLKTNVYYFSVTGPNKEIFHVTQQPIPSKFDFQAFNKKFLNPDNFTTDIGTVTAGPIGTNMLGSIRTSKHTWVLVNASSSVTQNQLETVIRSFELQD